MGKINAMTVVKIFNTITSSIEGMSEHRKMFKSLSVSENNIHEEY